MPYILVKMINMSITAGWMILAAVVLRLILKRAPKAVRYVLWALVAVRLILPVSFESVISLIPNTDPVDEFDLIYTPYETEYIPYTEFDPSVNPDNPTYLEMFVAEAPEESAISSDEFLTVVWICGTAAMIVYCIISYAVLRHKVRASVRHKDNIYLCDSIGSPFILGTVRPKIYMPSNINEEQLSAVEAHERMHIRHGDHLWKVLGFLILSAYWWNPLIWLAYILFCRDIELICDEAVVRTMDIDDRRAYSEALLSFSSPRRLVSACPLAFGEVGVRSRIKSVLSYKKPALWIIIASIIVCTVTAVCLLTDPVEEKETDPFMYDRIDIDVFHDGEDVHFDRIESIKEGVSCTLPGYGDTEKITCTIEKADKEKKVVKLKFDHPLCRSSSGDTVDSVSLLLDTLAYEGIGNDSVTLEAPDGSGKIYYISHAMIKGIPIEETVLDDEPEETRPIDEYIKWGKLPEESAYADKSCEVTVQGMLLTYSMTYYNSNNYNALKFFNALDIGTFEPIELDTSPELEHFSLAFRNKYGDLGDYTVYEDDTVIYGAKKGRENTIYFKASDGTFDRLVGLEEDLNGVSNGGFHIFDAPIEQFLFSNYELVSETFRVSITSDKVRDSVYLVRNTNTRSYELCISSPTSDSGLPLSLQIVTNVKSYTLSLEKTDDDQLRILAEYDGKKLYYYFSLENGLVNPEGYTDFQFLTDGSESGFIGSGDTITDKVTITKADISGSFAFTVKADTSDKGYYSVTYVPDSVYKVYPETDENGFIKLIALKGEKRYVMDIVIEDGELILDGAPEDFGEGHTIPEEEIPDNTIDFDYANLDSPGSNKMDIVYITGGPLSERYSLTVTVKGDLYTFYDSYAYDEYRDIEFVKAGTRDMRVKLTGSDGSVSLYGISCDYVGFKVDLELLEGEDILEKLYKVTEINDYTVVYSSESADIDGDGTAEIVAVGPGMHSGLRSFSLTIKDGDKTIGPQSFVSDSIFQTLVKGDDGKLRLRAEYEDEVIYYEIYPETGGILVTEDGVGVK